MNNIANAASNVVASMATSQLDKTGGVIEGNLTFSNGANLIVSPGGAVSIGTATPPPADYSLQVVGDIYVGGRILPGSNLLYNLGSNDRIFQHMYFAANTVDMGGVQIGLDSNNNIRFKDTNNNLKKLVVGEIQFRKKNTSGSTGSNNTVAPTVKVKKNATTGAVDILNVKNGKTINPDTPVIPAVQVNSSTFVPGQIDISSLKTAYVPSKPNINYGRVNLKGDEGLYALGAGAEATVVVNHGLATTDYFVYTFPDDGINVKVRAGNYTLNTFSMYVRNTGSTNLTNVTVNYQIIKTAGTNATTSNVVTSFAQPINILKSSSNVMLYTSTSNVNRQINIPVSEFASDPKGYPITFSNVANTIGTNVTVVNNNIRYTSAQQNKTGQYVLYASNKVVDDPSDMTKRITVSVTESFLNPILSALPDSVTTSGTTSCNLPTTDQGQPVYWSLSNNVQPCTTIKSGDDEELIGYTFAFDSYIIYEVLSGNALDAIVRQYMALGLPSSNASTMREMMSVHTYYRYYGNIIHMLMNLIYSTEIVVRFNKINTNESNRDAPKLTHEMVHNCFMGVWSILRQYGDLHRKRDYYGMTPIEMVMDDRRSTTTALDDVISKLLRVGHKKMDAMMMKVLATWRLRVEEGRRKRAVRLIEDWWLNIVLSPYNAVGRRFLRRFGDQWRLKYCLDA